MKTTLIFETPDGHKTARFEVTVAPSTLQVGDSLSLNVFGGHDSPVVKRREWRGQDLFIFCEAGFFLMGYLVSQGITISSRVDDFILPHQEWK